MHETADLLLEYIRKLYPTIFDGGSTTAATGSAAPAAASSSGASGSIADELAAELSELRGHAPGPAKRARTNATGEHGAVSALAQDGEEVEDAALAAASRAPRKCRMQEQCRALGLVWFPHPAVDMAVCVDALFADLAADRQPRTRHVERLVPLQRVVAGYTPDVVAALAQLVAGPVHTEPQLPAGSGSDAAASAAPPPPPLISARAPLANTDRPTTWATDVAIRNNSSVDRKAVLAGLVAAVPGAHLLLRDGASSASPPTPAAGGAGASRPSGSSSSPGAEAVFLVQVVGPYAGVTLCRSFQYQRCLRYNVRLATETPDERGSRLAVQAEQAAKQRAGQQEQRRQQQQRMQPQVDEAAAAPGPNVAAATCAVAEDEPGEGVAVGSKAAAAAAEAASGKAGPQDVVVAGLNDRVRHVIMASGASARPAAAGAAAAAALPRRGQRGSFLLELGSGAATGAGADAAATAAADADGGGDVEDDGDEAARVDYVVELVHGAGPAADPAALAVDLFHTYTPPSARGRGVARLLVQAALEWAVAAGLRLAVPTCSYVAETFPGSCRGLAAAGRAGVTDSSLSAPASSAEATPAAGQEGPGGSMFVAAPGILVEPVVRPGAAAEHSTLWRLSKA